MSEISSRTQAHLERMRASLAPDLEVLRPLGQGSVARVYLAREPVLQRLVAVKVLRDDVAADTVTLQRFEREAQAVARINHPNVTSVYRVGRAGRVPYIVMEYVDGRTLADILAAGGPMTNAQVRGVMAATSDALAAAHRKGIVHRHVRPVNVMIEEESGRVVLMDFGMAALLETGSQQVAQLTAAGVRVGDPLRMSPEQQRGETVGPAADVYAVGLLGYELLLGGLPRFGLQTAAAGPDDDPPPIQPIEELRPDVDPTVAGLIRRCLAYRPEQRPRASDVVTTLTAPAFDAAAGAGVGSGTGGNSRNGQYGAFASIPGFQEFVGELERRKTGRVAIGYIIAAFLCLSILDLLSHALPGGEGGAWHLGSIAVILGGFPIALIMSWLFDITASGIRREHAITTDGTVGRSAIRFYWLPALGLTLSVLVVALIWWAFGPR